ncbi:MAG: thermonuclease family protein [Candidatus Eisenbacteria bacterium]|nr:thermonuclease family protein [Candidatus Eisenbacteria bacterium]
MIRNRKAPLVLLLLLALLSGCAHYSALETDRAIEIPKESIIYDDGDTITFGDITIRVLGIDTPEIAHPEHGFHEDQPYGREAAARAEELIRAAKRVTYLPYQNDHYGRLLAHLFIDGDLLGVTLIEEGLAYETVSHYGDNGFPEIAAALLAAAERAPEPRFIPPHEWRQEHRKEPAGD